ncbi:MAG: pyridoxal phosphate-dependent aminotransferase [Solirubrobacteraceae bacterium]
MAERALKLRPWLAGLPTYTPGRKASGDDGSMASNEAPFATSVHVHRALVDGAHAANRYPDPLASRLRDSLAALHGVDPDCILITNGSDEAIFLLAAAYLAGSGTIVCADPAYSIDALSARVVNANVVAVPLSAWSHDLEAMAGVQADIAYVVNPHNPTGTVCTREQIERFASRAPVGLVVVDEAYIDFTDDPKRMTAIPLTRENPRLAVLRTFSKAYGLAALRIGYLIADPELIARLRTVRAPFSVNALAQAAAAAALEDTAHHDALVAYIRDARAKLTVLLREAGFETVASQANFVLIALADERGFVDALAACGISVRPGSTLGAPGTVRISVPSRAGMELLDAALRHEAVQRTARADLRQLKYH